MNMNLKTKLMMMSRKALVATAAGALTLAGVIGVGATAYVRGTPVIETASDLAGSLLGRGTVIAQPVLAQIATPTAPAGSPVTPFAAPVPVQTAEQVPAPVAEQQPAPAGQAPVIESVRSAVTEPQPTSTPGAEPPAPVFVPTATTVPTGAAPRKVIRTTVVRRAAPEICN